MPVYVDQLFDCTPFVIKDPQAQRVFGGKQASHMWADTVPELHQMAHRLGLKRAWFQNHTKLPHYDLTPNKRRLAMALGAIEKDLTQHFNEQRLCTPSTKPKSSPSSDPS